MEQNQSGQRRSTRVRAINSLYAQGIKELKNSSNYQGNNKSRSRKQRNYNNAQIFSKGSIDPDQQQYPAIIHKDDITRKIMVTIVPPKKKIIQKQKATKLAHKKLEPSQNLKKSDPVMKIQYQQNIPIVQHPSSNLLNLLWTQINKVANLPQKKQEVTESEIPINNKDITTTKIIQQGKKPQMKKENRKRRIKRFSLRKCDK